MENRIYLYDGSFEGLLTAVFYAWNDRALLDICSRQAYEAGLFEEPVPVGTEEDKAARVHVWMRKRLGNGVFRKVYRAFLTEEKGCEKIILDYLRLAAKRGREVDRFLTDPAVNAIDGLERAFCGETHKMYGFLRFKESATGVLYAVIGTRYNQLEPLIVFFHERLPGRRLVIYDEKRKLAAVCDGSAWYITERLPGGMPETETTEEEAETEAAWKEYLDALTVQERENKKLQRQMMPLRYRPYMTEFSEENL